MDIRINREIRDYSEKLVLGLTLREAVFSAVAVIASLGMYFMLKDMIHIEIISWLCVLVAAPFVFLGFFKYHELPAEQIVIRIVMYKRSNRYLTYTTYDYYGVVKAKEKRKNEIKDGKGHSGGKAGGKKHI